MRVLPRFFYCETVDAKTPFSKPEWFEPAHRAIPANKKAAAPPNGIGGAAAFLLFTDL